MASQPESNTWEAGVLQWETSTPALGGPGGPMNSPLLQLANRTKFLKNKVDTLSPLLDAQIDSLRSLFFPVCVTLDTPGTHAISVPEGYTILSVDLYGAGGGGFKESSADHGEGGSGGGWATKVFDVANESSVNVVVGEGASVLVAASGTAPDGGDTYIEIQGHRTTAFGGRGGAFVTGEGGLPGLGGSFSGADFGQTGQRGGDGDANNRAPFGGAAGGPLGGNGAMPGHAIIDPQWPGGGGCGAPDEEHCSSGAHGGAFLMFYK